MQFPQPGSRFGRYLIEDRIGMGGMGVVFRAVDTNLNRVVALKVVSGQFAGSEEFLRRFEREADVMARLDSPHVIAIFDHGVEDDLPWISTQFVGGGDLGQLLRRGPLHLHHAATVCGQVAHALEDAHRVGVVHRDVKPSNVLVREGSEPWVYLCDFGIAHTGAAGLTATGGVAGSWAYLAPERTSGHPGTPASDIYSLGCLLHATLTGRAPYVGSDVEVALAQVNAPIPQFPGTDPTTQQVNEVLRRSMAKDPAERYRTAGEFRSALLALIGATPVAFPLPPAASASGHGTDASGSHGSRTEGGTTVRRPAPAKPRRRRWPIAAGLAVLLLAGVAVGAWLLRPDRTDDPETITPVAGDIDGDGKGDLLFRWYGSGLDSPPSVDYLLRSDGTTFGEPEERSRQDGIGLVGDVDGDGLMDAIGYDHSRSDGTLTISIRFADDRVAEVVWETTGFQDSAHLLLADVDGDGRDDLVLITPTADPSEQARSDGIIEVAWSTGDSFADPEEWGRISNWSTILDSFMTGDLDGDGRDDLVIQQLVGDPNSPTGRMTRLGAWTSTGTGFERAGPLQDVPDDVTSDARTALGDVDGDGRAELVLLLPFPDRPDEVRVAAYDGALGEPVVWFTDSEDAVTAGIALSDVDGDGLTDLVLLRGIDEENAQLVIDVARSDGSAFEAASTWATTACVMEDCKESWHLQRRGG